MELTIVEKFLTEICTPPARVAVLGTGHYLRSDDFLGVKLIQNLQEKVNNESVLLIEAETAPNTFVPLILDWKPTHLLIVDAAALGLKPGAIQIIKREQMATFTHSSHARALTLLIDLVAHYLPKMEIHIIGVQPVTIDFEIGLSPIIEEVVERLTGIFNKTLSRL